MLRASARAAVAAGLARAIDTGRLPDAAEARSAAVELSRPSNAEHGDLASNLGLRLAKPLRLPPLAIATAIAEAMSEVAAQGAANGATPAVASVAAVAPGFLNLRLAEGAIEAVLDEARREPAAWGRTGRPSGDGAAGPTRHVNVEFVSANPTGPLTVGNARGAFVGDLLSRVLEAGGQRVTREYYFNDSGNQVRNLGASVLALREGREIPEDGYHGEYLVDVARDLPDTIAVARPGDDEDTRAWAAGRWASAKIREQIEASLAHLGVRFDVWTTEESLHENGWVEQAMERLRAGGHLYEQDGALWFRSTAFGDDKDRVVRRSDGELTYFGVDIGFHHFEKFERADHVINFFGPDHHGYIQRLRAAMRALGHPAEAFDVLIVQLVTLLRDGQPVRMSKRRGEFVLMEELLEEVGRDAARFTFLTRRHDSPLEFDLAVATRQTSDNPVFYVQYAHARTRSVARNAAESGVTREGFDASLLTHE
ncbi:MAG TPA: arginine--tRNA ligase, partial [Nocardioidaceae bacterium]|nr:arginine--tRNA ligase [Nocardioidaceae bacterium]